MNDALGDCANRGQVELRTTGATRIRFCSHYRWIDVWDFAAEQAMPDNRLLAALIQHREYRTGVQAAGKDAGFSFHGQYRLASIKPEMFELVDGAIAADSLDEFCSISDVVLPQRLVDDVNAVVRRRLESAERVYRLLTLKVAEHVFGRVFDNWREFVLINSQPLSASLVVMASD